MDALTTELLEALWRARVNLWVSTFIASCVNNVLQKDGTSITKTAAVYWTPEGKREKGRRKTTSRIGSISSALSCLRSGKERGLLSRTAGGNRAHMSQDDRGRDTTTLFVIQIAFFRYSPPIHWLVHGHMIMISNSETVYHEMQHCESYYDVERETVNSKRQNN